MEITVATAYRQEAEPVELIWYRMPYLRSQLKPKIPYIFYGKLLTEKGIRIHRSYVGNYFTSMEMMGATLTVMKLDDELKELIDMPVNCMGMQQK